VAYGLEEAKQGNRLAFLVDDKTLGKSRILAIHAREQIFGGIRPMTESADAYAQALQDRAGPVASLDSRLLTTLAKP
jgi:serine/threonine-protein kinase